MESPETRTYLPLLLDLTGRAVLIVGGGKAAWQKVKALAPYGLPVTVVSPVFCTELVACASDSAGIVTLVERRWTASDLDGRKEIPYGLVLACTDDLAVNDHVVAEARKHGLLALDAARPHRGDFIQPATRKKGPFILAVSSGGTGPKRAVSVRNALVEPFDAAVEAVLAQESP